MGLNRREMMMAALSAGVGTIGLGGCASPPSRTITRRPSANTGYPAGPTSRTRYTEVLPKSFPVKPERGLPPHHASPPTAPTISIIGRTAWTAKPPVKSKVNPMGGVSKITIHHEGWDTVWFHDRQTTAKRIEKIRRYHVEDRRWGDIGYHYIIDRAGRVWEGRPIDYQGAHVSQNNENNIGILVLGNFDKQSPSRAHLKALHKTVADLAGVYQVKTAMVRSHQEIKKTKCPGKNLQRQMDTLRRQIA